MSTVPVQSSPSASNLRDGSEHLRRQKRETAPSTRARRRRAMVPVIEALWLKNRKVYGADKLWRRSAGRPRHRPGPGGVLMRELGICGVSRQRKKVFTTARTLTQCAPDLVNRDFTAAAPDQLWSPTSPTSPPDPGWRSCASSSRPTPGGSSAGASHRTCAPTWSSTPSRWPGHERLAAPRRARARGCRVAVHQCDSPNALDEIGARPRSAPSPIRSTTLAETTNGLYKTECVFGPTPAIVGGRRRARTRHPRLGPLVSTTNGCTATAATPPAEFEAAFYAQQADPPGLETNSPSLHQTQGDSATPSTQMSVSRRMGSTRNAQALSFPACSMIGPFPRLC